MRRPATMSWLALLLLGLCSAGCNSVMMTSDRLVGAPVYPPSDPANIQVLREKPSQAYVALAEVFVEPQSGTPPMDAIVAALKKRAAKYGADAVLITMDQIQSSGSMYMGGGEFDTTYGHAVRALAIKYTGK